MSARGSGPEGSDAGVSRTDGRRRAGRLAMICLGATTCLGAMVTGCAAPDGLGSPGGIGTDARSAVTACRPGDSEVASASACLVDDAACYELASGAYCTGPRGSVCPAGSTALATGQACPAGARCIRASESLECVIG